MDQLYREFGRLLRQRRRSARLTQDDVADRVGLARTSITNIEQGRQHVSLHMLYELADAVGAGAHELLPEKAILMKTNPQLEKNLGKVLLEEEQKDWFRRLVSKTTTTKEDK
jgi:transcriptional regulator with XRE-family HTH domain